jgi:Ca2+-binding EF-hand superfamily protein
MNSIIRVLPFAFGLAAAIACAAETTEGTTAPATAKSIDIAAVRSRADEAFKAADTDGNGTLSKAEFVAAPRLGMGGAFRHHGRHGAPGMHGGPPHDGDRGMGPPGSMEPGARTEMQKSLFAALDADGSGQLSADEFAKEPEVMQKIAREHAFARLDANGDGALSRDELPSAVSRLEKADTDGDGRVTAEEMKAMRRSGCARQSE